MAEGRGLAEGGLVENVEKNNLTSAGFEFVLAATTLIRAGLYR
jgi:hypothetical protein